MDASSDSRDVPSGIIGTKLLPPSPRFEEVPRLTLLAHLQAGSARKLTLIGAPAGYGKSTLLTFPTFSSARSAKFERSELAGSNRLTGSLRSANWKSCASSQPSCPSTGSSGRCGLHQDAGKTYRIVVRSELSERYAAAFEEMEMETNSGTTVLTGKIIDQPHLYGILGRLSGLT